MVYTKIHNKYYDLTGFDHPGGMVALSLAQDRDATELFELHHQFSNPLIISSYLQKYEVVQGKEIVSYGIYDWEKTMNSEFTKDIKKVASKLLGTSAEIKASAERQFEYLVLCLLLLLQIYFFARGYWFSIITFPLALWIFSVNVFHDGAHFSISQYWRLNSLASNVGFNLATPYHWYHQHTVGHHSFPNILGRDPDLYHVPDTLRHSTDVHLNPMHKYQHYLFLVASSIGIQSNYLFGGGFLCLLGFSYNGVVSLSRTRYLHPYGIPLRLIVYIIVMHMSPLLCHGVTVKGFAFSFIPEIIFAALFTICSQVNHLTPDNTERFDSNFFVHQVQASHNINTNDYWTRLFTGGLNMQIEHHLFPSVNHCHLKKLAPQIKDLCKKHGVRYSESPSLIAAIKKHIEHLYNMGPLSFSNLNIASHKED